MDQQIIVGIVVIVLAHGFSTALVLWSKKSIDIISKKNLSSAREIRKELKNGR